MPTVRLGSFGNLAVSRIASPLALLATAGRRQVTVFPERQDHCGPLALMMDTPPVARSCSTARRTPAPGPVTSSTVRVADPESVRGTEQVTTTRPPGRPWPDCTQVTPSAGGCTWSAACDETLRACFSAATEPFASLTAVRSKESRDPRVCETGASALMSAPGCAGAATAGVGSHSDPATTAVTDTQTGTR